MTFMLNVLRVFRQKIRLIIDNFFEYPLAKVSDIKWHGNINAIPAVVYQTCEANFFGKTHKKQIEIFRDLNKGVSFHLYNEKERDQYMLNNWKNHPIYEVYDRAKYNVMRADIFRYCIVYDRGGYYFDINKGINGSIIKLHSKEASGMISFEGSHNLIQPHYEIAKKIQHPDKLIIQWGFGFKKKNIVLKMMIDNICDAYPLYKGKKFDSPKFAILSFTGPGMFTKTFLDFLIENDMRGIEQIGIDFNKKGILYMRGSRVMNQQNTHYSTMKNTIIVS
jgi:mannosyltransferase OCH1-like enzyme